jgi:putative PEP-CTERM system TPR-repeat lipoprotein
LADFAAASRNEKEYVEWLDKAARTAPKALEPKAKLIAYHLDKKENQKALVLAREIQAANPNSAHVWGLLGRTQLISGEKENAVVSFTKATQLAPDAPSTYLDLGVALAAAGRVADARAAFSKALAMNADYFDARRALINLELQQGKGADALKLAEEQRRRQPKSPAGPVFEGDAFMVLKQYAKAVNAYERAFALAKDGGFVIKIHQAMRLAGDESGADARVVDWLKGQPNDLATRIYLADSLAARKHFKAAIEHYDLALQKSPNNPLILNNLATAYSETNDGRALATAERASKFAPANPAIKDTLGWILVREGKAARAVELLKQATDAVQNSAEIRYHYAVALAKTGDKAKAKQEIDKAFKLDKQFPSKADAEALRNKL